MSVKLGTAKVLKRIDFEGQLQYKCSKENTHLVIKSALNNQFKKGIFILGHTKKVLNNKLRGNTTWLNCKPKLLSISILILCLIVIVRFPYFRHKFIMYIS